VERQPARVRDASGSHPPGARRGVDVGAAGRDGPAVAAAGACGGGARPDGRASSRRSSTARDISTWPVICCPPTCRRAVDVVTAVAMLHHIDQADGLARLCRLVAPGGVLLVVGLARSCSLSDSPGMPSTPSPCVVTADQGVWRRHRPRSGPSADLRGDPAGLADVPDARVRACRTSATGSPACGRDLTARSTHRAPARARACRRISCRSAAGSATGSVSRRRRSGCRVSPGGNQAAAGAVEPPCIDRTRPTARARGSTAAFGLVLAVARRASTTGAPATRDLVVASHHRWSCPGERPHPDRSDTVPSDVVTTGTSQPPSSGRSASSAHRAVGVRTRLATNARARSPSCSSPRHHRGSARRR
jgi:hypothetical protein